MSSLAISSSVATRCASNLGQVKLDGLCRIEKACSFLEMADRSALLTLNTHVHIIDVNEQGKLIGDNLRLARLARVLC